jgi:hypothetical protein
MGGIENWEDAAEFLAVGCSNLQFTTSVMQYGYRIVEDMISGLSIYLAEKGYAKLSDFVGAALKNIFQRTLSTGISRSIQDRSREMRRLRSLLSLLP